MSREVQTPSTKSDTNRAYLAGALRSPLKHYKILVTGAFQSGKTQFIRELDRDAICMERTNSDNVRTTIGFDFACFIWGTNGPDTYLVPKRSIATDLEDLKEGVAVRMYGMPGLKHFSTVREILSQKSDAIILMVDSSKPQEIEHSRFYYQEMRRSVPVSIPVIILANKQDLAGVMSCADIQKILGTHLPVLPVSAKSGQGIKEAMDFVMKTLLLDPNHDTAQ